MILHPMNRVEHTIAATCVATCAALSSALSFGASAQAYPTKSITLAVAFSVGGSTPEQATRMVEDEIKRWSAVIKTVNIKAD